MIEFKPEQIDDGTGVIKPGYLLECSCGGDIFYVFVPGYGYGGAEPINSQHLHYQCGQCEQSYCTLNTCELTKQETSEAAQGLYPR